MNLIRNTNCANAIKGWEDLTEMMKKESNKTCYGLESVEKANQLKAIDTLYLLNELYRSEQYGIRGNYIDLVESVKKSEGKVFHRIT